MPNFPRAVITAKMSLGDEICRPVVCWSEYSLKEDGFSDYSKNDPLPKYRFLVSWRNSSRKLIFKRFRPKDRVKKAADYLGPIDLSATF